MNVHLSSETDNRFQYDFTDCLLLLTSTIGMMPSSIFAFETIDSDGDGSSKIA